jgi:hypothetical protein
LRRFGLTAEEGSAGVSANHSEEIVMTELSTMVELTGPELDAVAAGAKNEGLIVVSVEDNEIVKNVNVAVAAAVLSKGGAVALA